MLRFYFVLLLLTGLIGAAMEAGVRYLIFQRPSFGFEILLILSFFTALIFFRLYKTQSQNFTQAYLLTIVLKLLLGGILISIILFMDKKMAVENALSFISCYLLFTALEVFFLFKKINGTSKS